jgi:alkylation response protein AidB-like acyl-CoA dehydrogenase
MSATANTIARDYQHIAQQFSTDQIVANAAQWEHDRGWPEEAFAQAANHHLCGLLVPETPGGRTWHYRVGGRDGGPGKHRCEAGVFSHLPQQFDRCHRQSRLVGTT